MSKAAFFVIASLVVPTGAMAVDLEPGDILVGAGGILLRVDPVTGDRTTIASGGVGGVGSGPLPQADSVVIRKDGAIFTGGSGAIQRVDPLTGDRTTISGPGVGSGRDFRGFLKLSGMAFEPSGSLVVTDSDIVWRVDPVSGDRTTLSSTNAIWGLFGLGPSLKPQDVAIEADGSIVVANEGGDNILRIDPTNGNRTVVSGCDGTPACGGVIGASVPGQTDFAQPWAIRVAPNGALLVADRSVGAIFSVNPVSGDRAIISGCTQDTMCGPTVGGGPIWGLWGEGGLALEASGSLIVGADDPDALVRVDPATGDRTAVSLCLDPDLPCPIRGTGPQGNDLRGNLAIVRETLTSLPAGSRLSHLALAAILTCSALTWNEQRARRR